MPEFKEPNVAIDQSNVIPSPMSCRVSSVKAQIGDKVKKGDVLMVVDAMKMEHAVKAPRDAVMKKICLSEGQLVGEKKPLIELFDV